MYEYKVKKWSSSPTRIETMMNELGKKGWRLVEVVDKEGYYIFERCDYPDFDNQPLFRVFKSKVFNK